MVNKRNCKKICDPKVSELIFKMFQNASNIKNLLKIKRKPNHATTIAMPLTTKASTHLQGEKTTKINKPNSHKNGGQKKNDKLFRELQYLFYSRIY